MKGRFAPSPSGRMHLGNLLCALLAWLSVRSARGRMVLRIEDLDTSRCNRRNADILEEDLKWLGLDWDEGGSAGGEQYYQSRRSEIYEHYFSKLQQKGLIYPCFCSRAELHAANAPHLSDGRVIYSGKCRALSDMERQTRVQTELHAMRVQVPDRTICFTDGFQGPYQENLAAECGDFVVKRADGGFAYQLAVVVDDALMGVTQVVRGRDLLSSTPRQIWLYEELGLPAPSFSHIPLLLAPDGRRLSKREKDLDMGALRARFSPEELTGELAAMCGLLDKPEKLTAYELAELYRPEKVARQDITVPAHLWEKF